MAYQLQEINDRIRADAKGFLEECDFSFRRRVEEAANRIVNRTAESPIVLLSGPSGSGKTTTALKLEEELERRGISTHTISMDNYFRTMNPKTAPRTPEGAIDYESPLNLDMELLDETFTKLSRGEEVIIPKFEIAGRHPEATKLYISARSNVCDGDLLRFKGTWMRLTRRAVRDFNFRGTDISTTLDMWADVRRGEKLYISPFKNKADVIIDSSLRYEVSVMKNYALPMLQAVPEENQRRAELLDLIDAFQWFEPIDPELVARDSLIREFIGGGSYKYH